MAQQAIELRSKKIVPQKVAVLAGGHSSERNISLKSGNAVAAALISHDHQVTQIDPAEAALDHVNWSEFDCVFLALHGSYGEDGRVQALLEEVGIPYTGSGVEASRLAFCKSAAKEHLAAAGVHTPEFALIHASDRMTWIQQQAKKIGYPLVIKPDACGSSLGVCLVKRPGDIATALQQCFHYDVFGIMERAVLGAEWTVAFIDDYALPPIEIVTNRIFFDYLAKYEDTATQYRFNAPVSADIKNQIVNTARRACQVLGTRGIVRVDLRMDEAFQPCVLEVNTIPGLTENSLVPKAAQQAGLSLAEICNLALQCSQKPIPVSI